MNKRDLIDAIAEDTGFKKKDVSVMIDSFLENVMEAVGNDEKVQLIGFGTFERRHRAARRGRNPQTGEELQIPATYNPGFRAGKAFRDIVRGEK